VPSIVSAFDLLPLTCEGAGLPDLLPRRVWARIRRRVRAGARCCNWCDSSGPELEPHELWTYDDAATTQRLERVEALCPECLDVARWAHPVPIDSPGPRAALFEILERAGVPATMVGEHQRLVWCLFLERSTREWAVDLTKLSSYGLQPLVLDSAARLSLHPKSVHAERGLPLEADLSFRRGWLERELRRKRKLDPLARPCVVRRLRPACSRRQPQSTDEG
jgi:hypothetical protein